MIQTACFYYVYVMKASDSFDINLPAVIQNCTSVVMHFNAIVCAPVPDPDPDDGNNDNFYEMYDVFLNFERN